MTKGPGYNKNCESSDLQSQKHIIMNHKNSFNYKLTNQLYSYVAMYNYNNKDKMFIKQIKHESQPGGVYTI